MEGAQFSASTIWNLILERISSLSIGRGLHRIITTEIDNSVALRGATKDR